MVGVLGGLGGFFSPIIFGYLLEWTGLWCVLDVYAVFICSMHYLALQCDTEDGKRESARNRE